MKLRTEIIAESVCDVQVDCIHGMTFDFFAATTLSFVVVKTGRFGYRHFHRDQWVFKQHDARCKNAKICGKRGKNENGK